MNRRKGAGNHGNGSRGRNRCNGMENGREKGITVDQTYLEAFTSAP